MNKPSNLEETEHIHLAHQGVDANQFEQELFGRGLKTGITEIGSNWTQENSVFSKWLESSANPTLGVVRLEEARQEKEQQEARARDLETREVEVFRNVHVDTRIKTRQQSSYHAVEGLTGASEMYCRNILDKYPRIPQYLTSRLAEANTQRTERLSQLRARNRQIRWFFLEYVETPTDAIYFCTLITILNLRQGAPQCLFRCPMYQASRIFGILRHPNSTAR